MNDENQYIWYSLRYNNSTRKNAAKHANQFLCFWWKCCVHNTCKYWFRRFKKKSMILTSHSGTPQKLEMICTDLQILLKIVTDVKKTRGVESWLRNTFETSVWDRKNTATRKVPHDFENSIASCLIICISLFVKKDF